MNPQLKRYALVLACSLAIATPVLAQVGAAAAAPASQQAPLVDPNKVIIQVGDEKITAKEFNEFIDDLPPQYQAMARGPGKRMLADELVKYKLMANEAKKRGLDKTDKVKRQMDMVKEQVLAAALAQEVTSKVDDAALQKYYDAHKGDYESVKARHILVRTPGSPVPLDKDKKEITEDQARGKIEEIKKRLDKGEDFATLAKTESDDKATAVQGGDLGTFNHGQMVKPFEDATFALKPNEISQPIKTPFGYHIIQVLEKTTPTLAQLKNDISSKLGPEKLDETIAALKKEQKPIIDETYFGPPTTQPTLPPGMGE